MFNYLIERQLLDVYQIIIMHHRLNFEMKVCQVRLKGPLEMICMECIWLVRRFLAGHFCGRFFYGRIAVFFCSIAVYCRIAVELQYSNNISFTLLI